MLRNNERMEYILEDILPQTILLLGASVLGVYLLRRINLPPLLGYLCIGIVIGPYGIGWLSEGPELELLGEIGLVFLLFMLGLEFSLPKLIAMRGTALSLGGSQVLLSTLTGVVICLAFGVSWQGALVLAGAMALSSTAIGVRQLTEQMEIRQRHGHLVVTVLLFQDLAAVPLLAVTPILVPGNEQPTLLPLIDAFVRGVLALVLVAAAGHWLLRPLFRLVAYRRSAELFTLATLFAALAAAWCTYLLGLSLALGAFLAGVMLGESEYRHQIESDMRPFRDVLMGVFFVTVGMNLNVLGLGDYVLWLLILVPGLIVGKGALIVVLTWLLTRDRTTALRTGIVLGQGGEFGFAVLLLALNHNVITPVEGQPIIASILISMCIAPLLIRHNGSIVKRLIPSSADALELPSQYHPPSERLNDHVILCGFGHVGQNLAAFLREGEFPYAALETDPTIVRQGREAGENVFYGDGSSLELLKSIGIERSLALAITFDDVPTAERIARTVRGLDLGIPILVRLSEDRYFRRLRNAGATDIVPEHVEAGTTLATHLFNHLNVPTDRLLRLVEKTRSEQYTKLRAHFRGETEAGDDRTGWRLRTVLLTPGSHAIGKALKDVLPLAGVSLRAIRRGAAREEKPDMQMILQVDDALILQGEPQDIARGERRLLNG